MVFLAHSSPWMQADLGKEPGLARNSSYGQWHSLEKDSAQSPSQQLGGQCFNLEAKIKHSTTASTVISRSQIFTGLSKG